MKRTEKHSELLELAELILIGRASKAEINRLNILLKNDAAAQRFYLDYIQLHTSLKSDVAPNYEIVRKRSVVDEVVVRPLYFSDSQLSTENHSPKELNVGKPKKRFEIPPYYYVVIALLFIPLLIWISNNFQGKELTIGYVEEGELLTDGSGGQKSSMLVPGSYRSITSVEIKLNSGATLFIDAGSTFKIFNDREIKLLEGGLKVLPHEKTNLQIYSHGIEANTFGGKLAIDNSAAQTLINASSEVKLTPLKWKPQHFWDFNESGDKAIDSAGTAVGIIGKGTKRVGGIVGKGALHFDNSSDARVDVGSGGGTAPATGSFSVSEGVTIEALIIPSYSGEGPKKGRYGEIDEIFRKDQSDKEHRLLLSFQNDFGKSTVRPAGEYKESLSFGLYIVGQGYHELKLPLDGQSGRPTLQSLKNDDFHHVAATYNVKTGLKAIFIDGLMLASFQYPPGSKVLSGGAGGANIGNSPNILDKGSEAYSGVIDEVGFYDFALTPYMINTHYQNARKGLTYFGSRPYVNALPQSTYIQLPESQWIEVDRKTGQPITVN